MDKLVRDVMFVAAFTPLIYTFTTYYPGLTSLFMSIMIVNT